MPFEPEETVSGILIPPAYYRSAQSSYDLSKGHKPSCCGVIKIVVISFAKTTQECITTGP
jgi:hypothetical protein